MREKPGVVEGGSLFSGSVTFYQRVVVVRRSNGTVELTIKFQGFRDATQKKNTGFFGNFSQRGGGGVFSIPKTFAN